MPRARSKRRTKGSERPNAVECVPRIMYGAWSDSPEIRHSYRAFGSPRGVLEVFIARYCRATVLTSSELIRSSFTLSVCSLRRPQTEGQSCKELCSHVLCSIPVFRLYGAARGLNRRADFAASREVSGREAHAWRVKSPTRPRLCSAPGCLRCRQGNTRVRIAPNAFPLQVRADPQTLRRSAADILCAEASAKQRAPGA
jgi:hypothetical protein